MSWCGRKDSNLHALAGASPSSWCVCQFRHFRKWKTARNAVVILDYHLTTENLKGNSRSLKNVDRPYKDTSQVLVVGRVCDGRVRLERLPHTSKISARAYIQGKHKRKSLRTSNVRDAKRLATEWWEELRVADRRGEHIHAARFAEIAQRYLARRKKDLDAKTLSSGQYRNLVQKDTLLRPFIGHRQVTTIGRPPTSE